MVTSLLPRIISGEIKGKPQDDAEATYDNLISKEDGVLDWQKPAERLEREVRAYAEWPKSRTILGGHAVIITKAHVVSGIGEPGKIWRDGNKLGVYTTSGILSIDLLKPAGKAEMTAQAFLNGYQLN
jgi:methionyl-tRNA formyltransferase